jgi:transcriptional regulator with XRE-family HTH domain
MTVPKWTPNKIKKLRTDLNLTQAEFGKRLGVSRVYVNLLEKGGEKRPSATLELLLDYIRKEVKKDIG